MTNSYVTLTGEFHWCKPNNPEKSPFTKQGEPEKWFWKTMFIPDQESLMKFMDLQSLGIKNKLSKLEDRPGYSVNFARPTEIKTKKGFVKLDPPKVFQSDGKTPLEESIGNTSKGSITLEIYEHKTPNGGKSHAARWDSMVVTDLVKYEGSSEAASSWDN